MQLTELMEAIDLLRKAGWMVEPPCATSFSCLVDNEAVAACLLLKEKRTLPADLESIDAE